MIQANLTDELEERLQQMTLPNPSLTNEDHLNSDEILYYYSSFIKHLQESVGSHRSVSYSNLADIESRHSKRETRSVVATFGSMSNI